MAQICLNLLAETPSQTVQAPPQQGFQQPQPPLRVAPGMTIIDNDFFKNQPAPVEARDAQGRPILQQNDSLPSERQRAAGQCESLNKDGKMAEYRQCYNKTLKENIKRDREEVRGRSPFNAPLEIEKQIVEEGKREQED